VSKAESHQDGENSESNDFLTANENAENESSEESSVSQTSSIEPDEESSLIGKG